jgi:hypothetical protein
LAQYIQSTGLSKIPQQSTGNEIWDFWLFGHAFGIRTEGWMLSKVQAGV